MRLSQILAVQKTAQAGDQKAVDAIYHGLKNKGTTEGFTKVYTPNDEEGELQSPKSQKVVLNLENALQIAQEAWVSLIDIVATKEWGNAGMARADLVVDGTAILKDVPATFFLYLEKKIRDVRAVIDACPTLDPADKWEWDNDVRLFRSNKVITDRSKKVPTPLVLYPATDRHPAQTQLVNEDIQVGKWATEKLSSALSVSAKRDLLQKCDKLLKAAKQAREEANSSQVEEQNVGDVIVKYIFD